MARAHRALPFLRFDRDPCLGIAADGTLKWILNAYTTSEGYSYAQRLSDGTTYMWNSVKLVIDAYDGSLKAYLSAPVDPLTCAHTSGTRTRFTGCRPASIRPTI